LFCFEVGIQKKNDGIKRKSRLTPSLREVVLRTIRLEASRHRCCCCCCVSRKLKTKRREKRREKNKRRREKKKKKKKKREEKREEEEEEEEETKERRKTQTIHTKNNITTHMREEGKWRW